MKKRDTVYNWLFGFWSDCYETFGFLMWILWPFFIPIWIIVLCFKTLILAFKINGLLSDLF